MHPSKWCSSPQSRWDRVGNGVGRNRLHNDDTHSLAAAEDVDVPRPAMVVALRAWTTHSVRQPGLGSSDEWLLPHLPPQTNTEDSCFVMSSQEQ